MSNASKRKQKKKRQIDKVTSKKPLTTSDAKYPTVAEEIAELKAILESAVAGDDEWSTLQSSVGQEILSLSNWTKDDGRRLCSQDMLTIRNQLLASKVCRSFVLLCLFCFFFFSFYLLCSFW